MSLQRFHIEVHVAPDVAEQRIAAALAAGGTVVDDSNAPTVTGIALRSDVLDPLDVLVVVALPCPGERCGVVVEVALLDDVTHGVREPVGGHVP